MTWRGALICSVLLHLLLAWLWFGHSMNVPIPEASPLAVMLQSTALIAPKPAVKVEAKPIAPRKLPQSAPAPVLMPAMNSNPVAVPLKKAESASDISVANTVPVSTVTTAESNAKSAGTAEVHAEGKITPAQYRAAHLQNPKPEMPYQSRINGESGTVSLWVKVGIKGEALAVKVEKSSGFTRLDRAAVQTVYEKWRFVPAKMGDTPIESEVVFNIPFKFDN